MKQLLGVLRGVNSNTQNFVFSIEEETLYRVGKDENSDIRINIENLICDTHCVIMSSPDISGTTTNVYLTDTSTTGTYLNACLIGQNKTVLLYSGCLISFASEHLNLQYIQCDAHNDGLFSAFTMTIQPGYSSSPIQQEDAGREISINITNKEIGIGSQSCILLAYDAETPTRQLACKYIDLNKAGLDTRLTRAYKTEVEVLKGNKHPNLMSLVALHENEYQGFAFLPLYNGGSLEERLNGNDPSVKQMNERDATFLMQQLFAGLDYLHDRDIIHCDLKPNNILLADRYTDRPRLVITDFGLSMHKASKPEKWPANYGTVAYHAPEMVRLEKFSDKVDSWAAGVIFYQLLVGSYPFNSKNTKILEADILRKEIKLPATALESVSSASKQIITQLTQMNQHQRSTIKQVMQIKTLFSWFGGDDKIAHLHYLRERELWFGEVECPSSSPRCAKQNTVQDDYAGLPDNVETIKERRDPSNAKTFLFASQTDFSLYPTLLSRFDSFRHPHEYL